MWPKLRHLERKKIVEECSITHFAITRIASCLRSTTGRIVPDSCLVLSSFVSTIHTFPILVEVGRDFPLTGSWSRLLPDYQIQILPDHRKRNVVGPHPRLKYSRWLVQEKVLSEGRMVLFACHGTVAGTSGHTYRLSVG